MNFPFQKKKILSKEEIAELLNMSSEAYESFEHAYQTIGMKQETDNFLDISIKDIKNECCDALPIPEKLEEISNRIVRELLGVSRMMVWKNGKLIQEQFPESQDLVSLEELQAFPSEVSPQLTSRYLQRDVADDGSMILYLYTQYQKEKNPKKKQQLYHVFRQGLDFQDLNPVIYELLGRNQNSIENWFPQLCVGVKKQDFFKIPDTMILQVPLPMLQLARLDYGSLTPATMQIVNRYCKEVFLLEEDKEYFIKNGVYSSKYDFRNAHVHGAKEVQELGEYLLFISHQASQLAAPLMRPCTYGPGTTRTWVVREYIKDTENNPCIYKGLPLHTEYRLFVDFDNNEILGISPYWEPNVMKQRFGHAEDSDSPHNVHDYIIYLKHEETLMNRYKENKDMLVERVQKMLPDIPLQGQWSLDIMQNGEDFYIIDMALAANSALVGCVPKEKLKVVQECWLPEK